MTTNTLVYVANTGSQRAEKIPSIGLMSFFAGKHSLNGLLTYIISLYLVEA